jgi:polysaccharide export outer membrane protein
VTDSGEVDVPLAGRVNAAGKTTAELASNIKSILEREYYYHATVIMGLDSVAPVVSRGRVYVTGAVRSRGALEMPPGSTLTVSQAITQSGGSSDFGDLKHVRIIRQGSKKLIVNVAAVLKDSPEKDVALEPDDTVFVPEKTFNINF